MLTKSYILKGVADQLDPVAVVFLVAVAVVVEIAFKY